MNLIPIAGFYWKHGDEISARLPKTGAPGQPSLLLDLIDAVAPVIKKHFPGLNSHALIDDFVKTAHAVMDPSPTLPPVEYPPASGG